MTIMNLMELSISFLLGFLISYLIMRKEQPLVIFLTWYNSVVVAYNLTKSQRLEILERSLTAIVASETLNSVHLSFPTVQDPELRAKLEKSAVILVANTGLSAKKKLLREFIKGEGK